MSIDMIVFSLYAASFLSMTTVFLHLQDLLCPPQLSQLIAFWILKAPGTTRKHLLLQFLLIEQVL